MTVNNNYRYPSKIIANTHSFIKELADIVKNCVDGRTNNTGEVTLTPSTTTTNVKNILCNENSVVLLYPITANAAADVGAAGSVYVVAGDQEFTIHHPSDADIDKTFRYVIIG